MFLWHLLRDKRRIVDNWDVAKTKIEKGKLNIFCLNEKGEPTFVDEFFGKEQGAKQYFLNFFITVFFNNFLSYFKQYLYQNKRFFIIFIIEQNPVNYTINDSVSQI